MQEEHGIVQSILKILSHESKGATVNKIMIKAEALLCFSSKECFVVTCSKLKSQGYLKASRVVCECCGKSLYNYSITEDGRLWLRAQYG